MTGRDLRRLAMPPVFDVPEHVAEGRPASYENGVMDAIQQSGWRRA
jgi:hypothetical protein